MPDLITESAKYVKGWTGGLPETPCGFGSRIAQTRTQREWIPGIVEKYDIHSLADIGAGDLNWVGMINWPHAVDYSAYDLVPRKAGVKKFDIVQQVPKRYDCLMCLWVLNHFPEDHAKSALDNMRASGSKYLLFTYEPRQWDCTDLPALESVVIRERNDARGNVEIRLTQLC